MTTNDKLTAIEQMATTIAHEVKNPLSLVQATIDVLELGDSNRVGRSKNYTIIRKELNKINEMMMDFANLFDYSEQNYDVVYVNDIVTEVIESYRIAHGDHVQFELQCEDPEYAVLGSKKGISVVVANLVKNAIEAVDGEAKIEIGIVQKEANIIITVADNGDGLGEQTQEKLFENFYTTKKYGNGLGLAICKKIINEHKGELTLSNGEKVGCVATITIPACE